MNGTEPRRARYPDAEGFVERDGVKVFWERYGDGEPAILFVAPAVLSHSRAWKAQIPYFARCHRVLVYDGRGNGRSARPTGAEGYAERETAADAIGVMDATGTERAVIVGGGRGCYRALVIAADHPERACGLFLSAPDWWLRREFVEAFLAEPKEHYGEGWDRLNPNYFRSDWEGYVRWWIGEVAISDPHSTRMVEDGIAWALQTDAEAMFMSATTRGIGDREMYELGARLRCPAMVMAGGRDRVAPAGQAARVAQATGASLITLPHAGHVINGRYPVAFNLALRKFVESLA